MSVTSLEAARRSWVLLLVVGLAMLTGGGSAARAGDEPAAPAEPVAGEADLARREGAVALTLDWLAEGGWSDVATVVGRFRDAISPDGALGDRVALGLLTLLDHGDTEVVVRAIAVIGDLSRAPGKVWPAAELRGRVVRRFVDVGTSESVSPRVRLAALETLVALPEHRAHSAAMTAAVVSLVETADLAAASRAADLLMVLPAPVVEAALGLALIRSQGSARRRLLDTASGVPILLDVGVVASFLEPDQAPGIRASAARFLGALVGRQRPFSEQVRVRVVTELVKVLHDDPAARVREAACRALGHRLLIDAEVTQAICLAVGDPAESVRLSALETLGEVGAGVRALDTVKAVVVAEGPETGIGAVAKQAGERIRRRTSLSPRPDQYHPRFPAEQKYAIAAAVARVPRREGIDVMISMLDDPDPGARQLAFRTLLTVTPPGRAAHDQGGGVPFGYRFDAPVEARRQAARRWREWFWEWRAGQGR